MKANCFHKTEFFQYIMNGVLKVVINELNTDNRQRFDVQMIFFIKIESKIILKIFSLLLLILRFDFKESISVFR